MTTNYKLCCFTSVCRWINRFTAVVWFSIFAILPASGQLAITEVMSNSSDSLVGGDDFWELTNFGTETIDLRDFWFRDGAGFTGAANLASLFAETGLEEHVIGPGESIVFVRTRPGLITMPEEFRSWWGLLPEQKIVFYGGFGFDNIVDAVNLWQGSTELASLVHRVVLFESAVGRTFTYDPMTGALDTFSTAGEGGAFVASTTVDVGSPGSHIGPVALQLVTGPVNAQVDGGLPVTFSVRAYGLPAPRYQWRFNGELIYGATADTFSISAASISDEGEYTVELDNGLERLVTTPAALTVNTQASCVTIVRPLADIEVTPYQTAVFRIETRGYPLPTFQWQFNGVDIPGATSSAYHVTDVDESRTGLYTVKITNPLCSTNATARLRLVPVPNLIITEAMSSPTNKVVWGHDTWWELTNAGTNAVNLCGYRWDDKPPSLEGAMVVTNDVILLPGRSAIFVSGMTPDAFRRWWGEENLPEGMPIIPHNGNGLSTSGDLIQLWNRTALTYSEFLINASFGSSPAGVSLWFDPIDAPLNKPSVLGERGAFRAAEAGDVGSPGWISNDQRVVRPRVTSIRREASGVFVTWKTQPGRRYELRYRDWLGGADWSLFTRLSANADSLTAVDVTAGGAVQRFYQVTLVP